MLLTRRLLPLLAAAVLLVGLASAADPAPPTAGGGRTSAPPPAAPPLGGSGGLAPSPAPSSSSSSDDDGSNASLAPLAAALSSDFSTFWDVVQAARMEKLFDDPTASFTVLAPTNDAWLKRLPSLTTGANLTAAQLLSDGKARVLEQVLNYHVLPGRGIDSLERLSLRGRLPTNAASCSTSKEIQVAAEQPAGTANGGQVTLASSLGGTARTVGKPVLVGGGASSIIPIDDVLLPSTVVIPTVDALAGPSSLDKSALPPATLSSLQAAIADKEPLPLTDEVGLDARERASQRGSAAPLPAVEGGDGGATVPDQPAPARRRVTVPTLPADDGTGEAAPQTPPTARP